MGLEVFTLEFGKFLESNCLEMKKKRKEGRKEEGVIEQ